MPLSRQQKEQHVAEVTAIFQDATSVVFVSFDKLTVIAVTQLRDQLAHTGSRMRVVPKRLLKLAAQAAKVDFDPVNHEGQLAIVWGSDVIAPAKTLYGFAKDHETLQLLAGVLENTMLSKENVIALAQLPSREELLGKLVRAVAGPLRGLVGVLSGIPRSFVGVLQAIAEQKQAA